MKTKNIRKKSTGTQRAPEQDWQIHFEEHEGEPPEDVDPDIIIKMVVQDWLRRNGLL